MTAVHTKVHYSKADLVAALRSAGVRNGQVVFSHSNIGFWGIPVEGNSRGVADRLVLDAFQEVLGQEGTLVVPTFTYSFCKGEPFDPDRTPSMCGMFTEMLRRQPGAHRSRDPIFSVAALGRRAREMTENMPIECFGIDSFWDRLYAADGVICNLNLWVISTFVHYVERKCGVPYRYDKLFTGVFSINGAQHHGAAIYFCRDMTNADTLVATEPFDDLALKNGYAKKISMGRGYITYITACDMARLIEETLPRSPFFLIEAGRKGTVPKLQQRTRQFAVGLRPSASAAEMIERFLRLPRDVVSDGYDAALDALVADNPLRLHEYPTGTRCGAWIVPEKWTCHEAFVETMRGQRIFSYADHPLHVASYSQPFEGVVSREVLLHHLAVHPAIHDAIPFRSLQFERDWGLCSSQDLKETLTDGEYKVVVRTDFSFSALKVGEMIAPGRRDECVLLLTHLDHPAQANDGLSGVVVGIEVMRALQHRTDLRYTYRLLIGPELFGPAAYLSHHRALQPLIKGALALDTLGLELPHVLQVSSDQESEFDRVCMATFIQHEPRAVIEKLPDEPSVLPLLALRRAQRPRPTEGLDFEQQHSHLDVPTLVSGERLHQSGETVLRLIDAWEGSGS